MFKAKENYPFSTRHFIKSQNVFTNFAVLDRINSITNDRTNCNKLCYEIVLKSIRVVVLNV